MSKTKLYVVNGENEDASGVFDQKFNLIHVIDQMHGEQINFELLEKLGFDVRIFWHSELVVEEKYIAPTMTNEIPNLSLVIEQLKFAVTALEVKHEV